MFERENPGFDAIVGNPAVLGRQANQCRRSEPSYAIWLNVLRQLELEEQADLVAHFFRRIIRLLRADGVFGLIATNTIAQGDTRERAPGWICQPAAIFYARRRRQVAWSCGSGRKRHAHS